MGLVLSVAEGQDIYVGEDRLRVVKVTGRRQFVIENDDGSAFTIEDSHKQEVLPEVTVCAGSGGASEQARIYIEAPREAKILRGMHYRAREATFAGIEILRCMLDEAKTHPLMQARDFFDEIQVEAIEEVVTLLELTHKENSR